MERGVEHRIGDLRHRLTIQSVTQTKNSLGESVPVVATFAKVYGMVEPTTGRETFVSQQFIADSTHIVTMRFTEGVTPKMQIVHRGRTFNIINLSDMEERRRKLIAACKEVVNDA